MPGNFPASAFILCWVEFAERASYYGVQTVFANFMQFPLPKGGNGAGAPPKGSEETAGALGKGLQFSTAFSLLFTFLAYVVPIFGAWVADAKLGRYKTIVIGVIVCGISHIIMIFGALPSVLQAGNGVAPFLVSLFILAIGAGIFKPNLAPLVIDQCNDLKPHTKILKSGEKVLVDPETTVQRIMLIFYGLINIGAFYAIGTTYAEKRIGYWCAFLIGGVIYFLLPILLLIMYKRTKKLPPSGSVVGEFVKVMGVILKRGGWKLWRQDVWDSAKPSVMAAEGITTWRGKEIDWTDKFIDDVRRTIDACKIFLYFPIYNLNDGGIGSVQSNQGAAMTTKGAPNDLLGNFNPLTIIVAIPLLSHVIYPLLNKYNIRFGRISRITCGFVIAMISSVIAAIVQWRVYKTSPCGFYASSCDVGSGVSPLSIWIQVPSISLGAISECFCNVTAYELAYARSPANMRSLVMALFLFTTALSSALGEILTPVIKDPYLIWIWGAPAVALAVQTIIFWIRYRHMNEDEFMTYEDDYDRLHGSSDSVVQEKSEIAKN